MKQISFTARSGASIRYDVLLRQVQGYLAKEHAEAISRAETDEGLVKSYIGNYLKNEEIGVSGGTTQDAVDRIYQDTAGTGFLASYLNDLTKLEEININAWDDAVVTMADGSQHHAEGKFLSPEHADTILTRLVTTHKGLLDAASPAAKVTIAPNTRMTIVQAPIVDADIGFAASIRTVNTASLSKQDLIREGSATQDILDFIFFCVRHGVSVVFAGEPGSGKTTTCGLILSMIPDRFRIVTLEHQTREFQLRRRDENGRVLNDVVHMITRPSEKPEQNFDLIRLIALAKTFDPKIMAIGEIVGAEAFVAYIAAKSFRVVTTTHSLSAPDTYSELASLAKLHPDASGFSDESLISAMTNAFPVVVYMKKLEDGSRRIMDVFEATGANGKQVLGNSLYRFKITDNIEDEVNGKPVLRVVGRHEKVNSCSEHLQTVLLDNGASRRDLERYV